MEAMRDGWADARLDDLNHRVEEGFRRSEADMRSLRTEMNERFESLHRLVVQIGGGIIATLTAYALTSQL
jgi:hypothetical protein